MIYALNTRDVSEHERRMIARLIRDDELDIVELDLNENENLELSGKTVHVLSTNVGEGTYYCIYCMGGVYKKYHGKPGHQTIGFWHKEGGGCVGSDKGLPGIINPSGITIAK